MVGHLGSFLERKATDIFTTKKDKGANDITFTVSQKKARGRDVPDWKYQVVAAGSWGLPEQIDETTTPKSAVNPDDVEKFLKIFGNDMEWPATLTDIRYKLFKAMAGITNNDKNQAYVTVAVARRFIIPQTPDEYAEGQRKPKYKLNVEPLEKNCPF